jgi:hypothetical protein
MTCKTVRPSCPPQAKCPPKLPTCGPDGFTLGAEEAFLFDTVAQEINQIAGTEMDFYPLDPTRVRDPLYDEPAQRVFLGPFRLKGYADWPSSTPEVREEGFKSTFEATFYIARKALDDIGAPYPNEGDVFRIWDNPYFNTNAATNNEPIPGAGYYFDAVDVDDQGHINDTAYFTGFSINVRRRTEFTPERRLSPP